MAEARDNDMDELRFRAMGTDAHVIVTSPVPGADAQAARNQIERLEALWSRFRPHSEVSRLNTARGMPLPVSPETVLLFQRASLASEATDGRFNPFVGDAVMAAGYDRSFEQLNAPHPVYPGLPVDTVRVTINAQAGVVSFDGGSFDPGGIGKGLASDIVVESLMASGVGGAMVNLGGDLRVEGLPPVQARPRAPTWTIALNVPVTRGGAGSDETSQPISISISSGAIATSTTCKRRWAGLDETGTIVDRHHIIDPTTGQPRVGNVRLATVVAGAGWWAEAVATSLTAGPLDAAIAARCSALLVDNSGQTHTRGNFERHVRETRARCVA